ncbi:MAG TPA: hypothetical protein VEH09_12170 [Thermodesulfobacteriota bacterium]|nr:hypothetical protein [Thermodesulfobacteriota bacterium]
MSGIRPRNIRNGAGPQNRGITTFGCLASLILLIAIGFVGVKVGQAFWNYYSLREQVREALVWAVGSLQPRSETEITQRVISNAERIGFELQPRNVHISQTQETLTITAAWTEELEFPYYTYPLNFEVNLTDIKRWGKGGLVVK